ncbi:helix-turn-helix domain-containing protein [Gilvimarinus algae]|uniref:Helix-turn-helix transcriptional regulator n=1 Tax=Gilvimarinus algae TaxID=3058037 RepID=A0ABT8TAE1_9GAMM|nr:helix-turn-helix transcriptional regulator [Gilvimarinus sp. SDUM040014]MDO3381095.1 helix-turn-helix transcriptional regulator [Gilvimarinus sp. SDUM040014]
MTKITNTLTDTAVAEALFERLENRRKAMSITQAQMAERVGVTPKTYRNLRQGHSSLLIFITVLRQLNLLESLESLIPPTQQRPTDLWQREHGQKHRAGSGRIAQALASRQKLKTETPES